MIALVVTAAVVAAVLSTLVTAWVVFRLGRRRLIAAVRSDLERAVDDVLPRLRAEVRSGVEEGADATLPRVRAEVEAGVTAAAGDALPRIREAVADGVRSAAGEIMPRLRAEVGEGIRQGVVDSVTPETLGRVGEEIARRGASVVESGLGRLLGTRRDHDDES